MKVPRPLSSFHLSKLFASNVPRGGDFTVDRMIKGAAFTSFSSIRALEPQKSNLGGKKREEKEKADHGI